MQWPRKDSALGKFSSYACVLILGEELYPSLLNFVWTRLVRASLMDNNTLPGKGGGGVTQQRFIRGRNLVRGGYDPRSMPSPLYIPLLPEMVHLSPFPPCLV